MTIKFDNSFQRLPKFLYEVVKPTPIKKAKLIHVSSLNEDLDLDLSDEDLKKWLNFEMTLPGEQRIATRYAGHQFGVWAGQLGDGRAISLGEILTPKLGRQEIQTKGSGLTPFSRMGDGKAVIRSSVREYLCSHAMKGLNIPTTEVLALIIGEDKVHRETVERSAIVARVFPSNLRFGHFEMYYHFKKPTELKALIDYTRETFFQGQSTEEMLNTVVERTAKLMAQWMGVGFCHGVMNTDNMSVLGLTIDYGPFGFLEDTVLNYVCNHSDHQGRYAYSQQPDVAQWNLSRFLVCFLGEVPQESLQKMLDGYPAIFETEMQRIARSKLGLKTETPDDYHLYMNLLKIMDQLSLDYTFTFRQLSSYKRSKDESLKDIWDYYGDRIQLKDWLRVYDQRLLVENSSDDERHMQMKTINPKYILKNYIAQEVIKDVEAGNNQKLLEWLEILNSPSLEHEDFHQYSLPTSNEKKNFVVSCSS